IPEKTTEMSARVAQLFVERLKNCEQLFRRLKSDLGGTRRVRPDANADPAARGHLFEGLGVAWLITSVKTGAPPASEILKDGAHGAPFVARRIGNNLQCRGAFDQAQRIGGRLDDL